MTETMYKSMRNTGAANIVVGILTIIGGIVSGVMMIVAGGKLLHNKSKVLY